ncbi:MAG: phage terminase large subunit [Acidobacteriota bacterium]|nr:phage terminase large subunit [Blastocatellia bacterium]MDQ3491432.1 phage terminase large subunit [Acidobacteriota bacterium]
MKKSEPPSEEQLADCRELYIKYGGRSHRKIEDEMRAKGWTKFYMRLLCSHSSKKCKKIGWIDLYGWAELLTKEQKKLLPRFNLKLEGFPKWLEQTTPNWTWNWKYQAFLYERLSRVALGSCRRLMIFLPPRHGKSELVTVRFVAWMLEIDPKLNVILGSYNQKLANRFSRKIKRVLSDNAAGRSKPISSTLNAVAEWETTQGGGVRAVGVGGGVTGFGAGLIVIDDPVKSRAEAESEIYRDKVSEWFNDDIYTRLEPDAAIILIQTRWHDDDLAGRLLNEMADGGEYWEVVSLPALAEAAIPYSRFQIPNSAESSNLESGIWNMKSSDPLGRREGHALCPQRFNEAALLRIKRKLGSYSFSALYQQRPVPIEGGLFKRTWFKNFVDKCPDGLRLARAYDLAVSTKTSADYTASFLCGFDKVGNLYIADGFRKRLEYPEQRRYVLERIAAERGAQHGIESALHGKAFVQDLRREITVRGVSLKDVRVDADKFTRALAWANLAEEGKVYIVRGGWNQDFLDEVCRFTGKGDKHDDQVDAVSLAVQMLSKSWSGFYTF